VPQRGFIGPWSPPAALSEPGIVGYDLEVSSAGSSAGRHGFDMVVVVASLGGLPVISTMLGGLPDTFRLPLIVVLHGMPNENRDRLTWLLHRHTALPIRTARHGVPALVAGVTVIPGGFAATIDSGRQICLAKARVMGGDGLMTTAAAVAAPGAVIAVVLTGMLYDGAAGARAVKRRGGIVLAQDPATARAPSMPSSAIATGCVDYVLAPERIAPALIALTMAPAGPTFLTDPAPPVVSGTDLHSV
jgi:two-component system, chemotaxis family, protein-glutamate methylesterase/glutaminase